jgi:hypothetical protein
MRHNLVRRLREHRLPPMSLIVWSLASWLALSIMMRISFSLLL